MNSIIIKPSKLNGKIEIQISKGDAHRSLIASALSSGKSTLTPWQESVGNDINITKNILESLSLCQTNAVNGTLSITPSKNYKKEITINAGESGTTLRLILPVLSALDVNATIICEGRLPKRPMETYHKIWSDNNIELIQQDNYIKTSGKIKSGDYHIEGNISSQFISGMIIGLSLLDNDSRIFIENKLESKPYIDMTISTLKKFGVNIVWENEKTIYIKCSQIFTGSNIELQGDWSHAAFFISAAALGGEIVIHGLDKNSPQGDKEIVNIINQMGGYAKFMDDNSLIVKHNGRLNGINIDVSNIPDLSPILAVLGIYARGKTTLYNAHRLRFKESDRITDLASSLNRLGAKIITTDDKIEIEGQGFIDGGKTSSYKDHRLSMAVSISSIIAKNNIELEDYEVASKSSTNFFKQFVSLGGTVK